MDDKTKLMASLGYMLVLADTFSTQIFNFYQFYAFGYYVNLLTLVPLIIYYSINKTHTSKFVTKHLKKALNIYLIYVAFSIVSGVFFEPNNYLWISLGNVWVTFIMLIVLIYISVTCGKGIIKSFKEEIESKDLINSD